MQVVSYKTFLESSAITSNNNFAFLGNIQDQIYLRISTAIWRLVLLNNFTTETSQDERFLECPSDENTTLR